ncbi:MAG TPA: hypothetical protein VKA85_00775, partial [Candidatus Limnocylindrales bacterium]|nr:hypothetical protein [Candidatus Limnocylindrales bacterium]
WRSDRHHSADALRIRLDPRGHRFGAGVSALLLVASFALNLPVGVAIALASIGVSAAFGLRWSTTPPIPYR